jgi:GNAT superfamily N-acetyltransferase
MQYRPGRESDFTHLETFVWQAIFPDFDVPGLTEEQRAENDAIVADSRQTVEAALERDDFLVISAWDERRRTLVGYLVLDASAGDFVVVVQLLVRRGDRGQGVGTKMLREAVDAADDRPIRIDVPAFAERAIAFFSRNGFDVTDDTPNEGPIPKRVLVHRPEPPTPPNSDIAFSFAFGEETAPASPPPAEACANCGSTLPPHANFCPHCGADQRAPLPEEPDGITNERIARDATPNADTPPDYAKLRSALEDLLGDRLTAYFGADALPRYLDRYRDDTEYHRIRDVSLRSLAEWLPHQLPDRKVDRRIGHDLGELVEYFIVESAADLHPGLFAQKLLRYQHPDWKTVDMFRLVMDYLNFREERETIYTDFAQAPARVIRHASQRYLGARQDERVFFICDQSWLGSGKQGFALTDAGIYWKPILQPAAAFAYVDLQPTQMNKGHLRINGHYFDAGSSLNRKLALLLDKLRRIDLGE